MKQKKNTQVEQNIGDLSGVQTDTTIGNTGVGEPTETSEANNSLGVKDALFGIPDVENSSILPDLGQSREITTDDVLNQQVEPVSTEEELDAADALLSLSNVRDNFSFGLDDAEDNSLLMPIGGSSTIEDVAPQPLRLGQVEVDGEIAKMLTSTEQDTLVNTGIPTGAEPTDTVPDTSALDAPTPAPVGNPDQDNETSANDADLSSIPDTDIDLAYQIQT